VRYFSTERQAKDYIARRPATTQPRMAAGSRQKATWSADEPGIITSQTKIIKAPAPPRGVYRTNTYLHF
jgi:hypothetical protein